MVKFTAIAKKYDTQGEKTGWTYIEIPEEVALKINPGCRKSYRVKGLLNNYAIQQVALIPVGEGCFILPLNAEMRKKTGTRKGSLLTVQLALDKAAFRFSEEMMVCLEDEPEALAHFNTLKGAEQRYFSKWIDSAKTEPTKAKRIALMVNAMLRKQGFAEMLRAQKAEKQ